MKRTAGSIWIVKPPGEMCGNGIRLVTEPEEAGPWLTRAVPWLTEAVLRWMGPGWASPCGTWASPNGASSDDP